MRKIAVVFAIIFIVGLIVVMFVTQRKPADHSTDKVYIIRYTRKSCPYCVNSQAAWDEFVENSGNRNYIPLSVDIGNNSDETRYWLSKYNVTGVPTIVKLIGNKTIEYTGPTTAVGIFLWAKAA